MADSDGELWHKRLDHMSERGMHFLAEKDLLQEVKGMHLEKCADCFVGKQNMVVSTLPLMRRERTLELVLIDVRYVDA